MIKLWFLELEKNLSFKILAIDILYFLSFPLQRQNVKFVLEIDGIIRNTAVQWRSCVNKKKSVVSSNPDN